MDKKNKRRVVITALATTPVWVKPVIKQISLPAHAVTTGEIDTAGTDTTTTTAAPVTTTSAPVTTTTAAPVLTNVSFFNAAPIAQQLNNKTSQPASLLDIFIPQAHAQSFTPLNMLITLSESSGNVVGASIHVNKRHKALFQASNIPTNGTPKALSTTDICPEQEGAGHTHIAILNYQFNDTQLQIEITTTGGAGTQSQTLDLGSGSVVMDGCNEQQPD